METGRSAQDVVATKEIDMKRYFVYSVLFILLANCSEAEVKPEVYNCIKIDDVFSKMITRDMSDRVYSGLIKSRAGVREFEKVYQIELGNLKVNFNTQTLIFGITDNFSSRAFQFLEQKKLSVFTLDYTETGIHYKMRKLDKGNKYSFMQVFITKRIDGNPHIYVKNMIYNGFSKFFD